MRMYLSVASLSFAVILAASAFAAPREKGTESAVRALAVSAETKAEMARYSLRAYENCDPTNVVQALLFTPKPVGMNPHPMVV